MPPFVVYPYKARVPKVVSTSVTQGCTLGNTENGWMTGEAFYSYIEETFGPFLTRNKVKRPVILFLDGHKSHLTQETTDLCSKLKIVLINLYPNSTWLLQPCDVGVFKPLKTCWKSSTMEWYFENPGEILQKSSFAPVFKNALDKSTKAVPPKCLP